MIAPHRIYLDHAATTPLAPEVVEAMLPFLVEHWGNPSSPHGRGRNARSAVDGARDRLATVLGCMPRELTFTSGGTEADNLAVRGVLQRWGAERGRHLVVSAIEHEAVLTTVAQLGERGEAGVTVVPCEADGCVDPERIAAAVRDDTVLVSLMLANNEVGAVQDVHVAAGLARARNPRVLVHSDAVQALGKVPIDLAALDVDLLSVSAHKCYGPKGSGALYARWGTHLTAQLDGGGQERGRRSGTENVAAIAGFACAAELVERERPEQAVRQAALRDGLETAVLEGAPHTRVAARSAVRLPNLSALLVDGASADSLVAALDVAGVEVSSGSACSSGAAQPSHVMVAMGEDPRATALIRLSLGRDTSADEMREAAERIITAVGVALAPRSAPAATFPRR
ncbi:MAG: cysteine desulfurase [Candidatus Dormibacteraeota bacterium]|uniref:cysteine desulfurase n=1 Tax=Candidatus Aeolococcus gillhamiae TaxID=3127015 RepID=A0A2W5YXE5_9BACT|nr:cysteine desulfurase [Candidatus Dormibacteraeota bacterium]PZR77619.1 MAG: cysteine desulfurase NifS [Candidatus Dormibacter sp. RRmetagenome_bin12]